MKTTDQTVSELKELRATNGNAATPHSYEQLSIILDGAQVGISNCSREQRFKYVNKHYAKQQGLTPEEIIGKPIVDILGDKAYNAFKPFIDEVLTGKRVEQEVEVAYERLGDKRWIHIAYEPEYNHEEVIGWVAVVKDISKRKEAEENLRAREQQLSLIYANVNDVIFYLSVKPNGRFLFESVNHAFLAATGLVEAQVLGKHVDEVIPEPSLSLVLRKYKEAIEKKQTICWEEVTPYPNGEKTGIVSITPVINHQGVCTHLVGNVYDITERKKTEDLLRSSEERYRTLINSVDQGFCTIEVKYDDNQKPLDYRFVEVSPSFEHQTGIVNGAGRWMRDIAPDQDEYWFEVYGRVALTREAARFEYHSTPLKRWWSVFAYPIDEPGQRRIAVLFNDITERKLSEDRLQRSEERYRAFVAQSTEAIWRFELEQPVDTSLPIDEQIQHCFKYAYLAECNDAMAKMYGYNSYTEIVGARLGDLMPKENDANIAYLTAFMQNGYRIDDVESEELDKDGNAVYFVNNLVGIIENGFITRAWGTQRDVTKKKRDAAILRESNIRMELAQSATGFWTFEVNPATGETHMSEEGYLRYGISKNDPDVLATWRSRIHPDDIEHVEKEVQRCLAEGSNELEYRYHHPEKGWRWIYGRSGLFGDEKRMYGVNMDVTDRKQSETQLQRAHQRFLTAETALNGYVYEWDIVNNKVWRSENFTRVLGYNSGEVEETYGGFQALVHPDDMPRVRASFENVWRHKPSYYTDDFRVRHKNGSYIWMRDYGYLTWTEKFEPINMVGSIVNVHEQKVLELQLQETSEKLHAMLESLPHIAFMSDANGTATYFNTRWTEYSGQSLQDALDGNGPVYIHPDDLPNMTEWARHIKEGIPYTSETRYRRKDGQYRWHLVRVLPMTNNEGKIAYWIGTCTDIHDQKEFAQKLEGLVAERTQALQQSKTALERLNAELASFAYVASHDLREPIRKVLSFGDYLVKREKEKLSERGVDYLTRMHGAASRMDGMLDDLLAFSRVNTWESKRELLDLNSIVSQAKSTLSEKIEEANATIVVDPLPSHQGVAFQFRQLFIHLIDNAVKFRKADVNPYVEITNEVINGSSFEKLDPVRKYLRISVKDNGIGVEPQYHDRIFELFQRLHSKDKFNGTGIGLSICRKVAENHQGVITIDSRLDAGSTFEVFLPLMD